jgi:hypothetical protein
MDLNAAITYGLLVQAAEAMPLNVPGYDITGQLIYGYKVLATLYANDLSTDINPNKAYLPFGFIAQSPAPGTEIVVAIRGTETISEWVQDAQFLRKPYTYVPGAGTTEDGFTDLYGTLTVGPIPGARAVDALRSILNANLTLTICGHSLGSSVATLLALDVVSNIAGTTPTVYAFASPNVGDSTFAAMYDGLLGGSTWRIINQMDIVPQMPVRFFGYVPVDQTYPLNSAGKADPDPGCSHHMTTYLYLLGQLAGQPGLSLDPGCVYTPPKSPMFPVGSKLNP